MRGNPERLFERFRSSGDAAALEALLDLCGSEVYRVARSLARSGDEANELLQETWLAVLEARDTWDGGRRLMPWILGVLGNQFRRMRQRQVRQHRLESEAVHEPSAPESQRPDAVAGDREFSDELDMALGKVREPFRRVLELTLKHHKGPSEIATELGRESATVRGQLHRGMAMLRSALPAGLGVAVTSSAVAAVERVNRRVLEVAIERGWASAAPAPITGTWASKAAIPKGVGLSIGLCAVAAVVAFFLWSTDAGPLREEVLREGETHASDGANASDLDSSRDEVSSDGGTTAPSLPAPPMGSIVLELTWPDVTPAAGIGICFVAEGTDPRLGQRRAVTDGRGVARFDDVIAGDYMVYSDRGFAFPARVEAGTSRTARMPIPEDGATVRGRVVDRHGSAVVGARIWHAEQMRRDEGFAVADSAADGSFEVRGVPFGALIGARHDLFAPSSRIEILRAGVDSGVVAVELVMAGRGASLLGTVTTVKGEPLAGARVLVGPPGGWVGNAATLDSSAPGPARFVVETDAAGRFELNGLPAGQAPIRVLAAGYRAWDACIDSQSGAQSETTVRMVEGSRLRGRVVELGGGPLPAARVRLTDGRALSNAMTFTTRRGEFEFDCLAPGAYQLEVGVSPVRMTRQHVVVPNEPSTVRIEVSVPPARSLTGTLVHADGSPCANWELRLVDAYGGSGPLGYCDEQGRFSIGPCDDVEYEIYGSAFGAFGFRPCATGRWFRAGPKIAITLDGNVSTGSIRGAFRDEDDRPLSDARLTVAQQGFLSYELTEATDIDGCFRLEHVPPGRYELVFVAGRGVHAAVSLQVEPGEIVDLGVLRPDPVGRLVVDITAEAGEMPWNTTCTVRDAGNPAHYWIANYAAIRKGIALGAGRYHVEVRGPRIATRSREIEVVAGGAIELPMRMPAAVSRPIVVRWPENVEIGAFALRIFEEGGERCFEDEFVTEPFWGDVDWPALPVGLHTVEVGLRDGQTMRGTCRVDDLVPSTDALVVSLR